ncbi:MAG: hypothetical protein IID45_06000, partial [Planctomycetes bacterium]|nr:hypothetical protein [Planctomycetota bacterium]
MYQHGQRRTQRFPRLVSFLDFLKRGRARRLQKRRSSSTVFPSALESLECRTLLSASAQLLPTFSAIAPATMDGTNTDAVFATGADALISWNNDANATGYDLLVYDVNAGQEVLNLNSLNTNSHTPAALTDAERYQVFVRGTANGQNGSWSSPVYFTLTGAPAAAVSGLPGTPSFTGLTSDTPPALTWTSATNAANYELLIYNLNAGQEVSHQTGLTDTTYTPTNLLAAGDNYQAFVRAENANGDVSNWSTPFEFHGTGESQTPQAPTLTGFTNFDPPEIVWQSVSGAVSYEILVYSFSTGQEALNQSGLTETSYTPTALLGSTDDYQVFIRAENSSGQFSVWGGPLAFHMDANPQFPAAPTFDTLPTAAVPILGWQPLAGAASYELQVYSIEAGQQSVGQSSIADTEFNLTALQQSPGTYQAFLRAYDANGAVTEWTTPLYFEVEAAPVVPDPDPNPNSGSGGGGSDGGGSDGGGSDGGGSDGGGSDGGGSDTGGSGSDGGGGSTGDGGTGGGGSTGGNGSGSADYYAAFDAAMASFHGEDRIGKDGPMATAGLDLMVLIHETRLGLIPSDLFAPEDHQFQFNNESVLIEVTGNNVTDWSNAVGSVGGVIVTVG